MYRAIIASIVLLLLTAGLAAAQESEERTITLNAQEMPLATAIASIARQSQQTILTADLGDKKLTANLSGVPLDTALKFVCTAGKLSCRKVWVAPGPKGELDGKKIARTVRALDELESSGVMIQNPETGTTSVALSGISSKVKVDPTALPGSPAMKEIIFIYGKEIVPTVVTDKPASDKPAIVRAPVNGPAPVGGPMVAAPVAPVEQIGAFAHNQAAAMAALAAMGNSQQHDALRNNLQIFKQLDPTTQRHLARNGLQMYMSLDKATRERLWRDVQRDNSRNSNQRRSR